MQNVQEGRPNGVSPRGPGPQDERNSDDPVLRTWLDWFRQQTQRVDTQISTHLNVLKQRPTAHSRLIEAVEYALASGGKRLRPILVLESCRLCGGTEERAWPAALAVECIHTFSLIHDDLPVMDNDDLRRGKPTSHKVFGEAVALLAGDWLVAHAFELLAATTIAPRLASESVRVLAEATGDMVLGQGADLAGEKSPTDADLVRFIHQHKTARLLEASCRLGSLCAGSSADETEWVTGYGRRLGLAFQISDDLLDCTGTAAALGKRVGKDATEFKQTYPAAFGIEESRRRAQVEIEAAIAALEPFGRATDNLRHLARYVVGRDR